jgi:hypothetical protein
MLFRDLYSRNFKALMQGRVQPIPAFQEEPIQGHAGHFIDDAKAIFLESSDEPASIFP